MHRSASGPEREGCLVHVPKLCVMELRRFVGWSLVLGLSIAALVAIVALLAGDLGDVSLRAMGTSIGFGVFSALGAAGLGLLGRSAAARAVGQGTAAAATAAFVLLLAACWIVDDDWSWQGFGVASVLALCGAHASLVLRSARSGDGAWIWALGAVSVVTACIDALAAIVAILGLVDDVGPVTERLLAVSAVVLVLTTALPPVLRRMAPRATSPLTPPAPDLAAAVLAAADRLDALPGAGPEVRREAARLRALARDSR
jgi:hypothetical protein